AHHSPSAIHHPPSAPCLLPPAATNPSHPPTIHHPPFTIHLLPPAFCLLPPNATHGTPSRSTHHHCRTTPAASIFGPTLVKATHHPAKKTSESIRIHSWSPPPSQDRFAK